jgi:diguanylate cyclase (GGDEF)-like protein
MNLAQIHGSRSFSLKAILASLVVVSVAPAIAVAAWLVDRDYEVRSAGIYGDAIATARSFASDLDREISDIESGLRILATSRELATGDLAAFHMRATDAVEPQRVVNYLLLDPQGHQLVNTLRPWGSVLPTAGAPPEVFRVVELKAPLVTGLFLGTLTHAPMTAVCVPVELGGHVAYVLCGSVLLDHLNQTLGQRRLPKDWIAATFDRTGKIVARSRDAQRFVGQPAVPALVAAVAAKEEGTMVSVTHDGTTVLTAFSRSNVSGWSVAVGAPRAELIAGLKRSVAWLVSASIAALAIGMWLGLRLAGRIGSSVRRLIEPALAIGLQESIELPRSRVNEIAALGDAIVQASKRHSQVKHLAHHDPLTGLCNRLLLEEIARQRIGASSRANSGIAILAIDLDGFKAVNDMHGHAAGDLVLKTAGERITDCVRGADVRARLGGDEFVVLLDDATWKTAEGVAKKLLASLSMPYPNVLTEVSASIGVAIWPECGRTFTELMARADQALYSAKGAGKRTVAFDRGSEESVL